MNFFNVFEDRIASIFGASAQGVTMPFSFKKLARKAAHEMENETYVIAGVDTAPALYTVLVSETDNAAMRPIYPHLTKEISQFIEAQAVSRSYSFVGKPLVRFMVDPSLKSGKFSVFAENIDAETLLRLRKEEEAFLGGGKKKPQTRENQADVQAAHAQQVGAQAAHAQQVGAQAAHAQRVGAQAAHANQAGAEQARARRGRRQQMQAVTPALAEGVAAQEFWDDDDAGLGVIPATDTQGPVLVGHPNIQPGFVSGVKATGVSGAANVVAVPKTERRQSAEPSELEDDPYGTGAMQALAAERIAQERARRSAGQIPSTCLLIDRQSGRTYSAAAPSAIIGRERTSHGIVLRDPNVSRRHAELSCHDGIWVITDLNSTNGTLVNDVDVERCALRDGDVITLGLINLEFRAN